MIGWTILVGCTGKQVVGGSAILALFWLRFVALGSPMGSKVRAWVQATLFNLIMFIISSGDECQE